MQQPVYDYLQHASFLSGPFRPAVDPHGDIRSGDRGDSELAKDFCYNRELYFLKLGVDSLVCSEIVYSSAYTVDLPSV